MMVHNDNEEVAGPGHTTERRKPLGQALTEYALILALIVIGLIVILAITGPAIGNIFSNTVYTLLNAEEPRETLSPEEFWATVTAIWLVTPGVTPFETYTPAPATYTPSPTPSPTVTPTVLSPTPPDTETPGPSPTPEDMVFTLPWDDDGESGTTSRDYFIAPDTDPMCGWGITTERFRSVSHAWSDSPDGYYIHDSNCVLEFRGVIDLTEAIDPELTFWDSWHLVQYDRAYVEVQEEGTTTWTNVAAAESGSLHFNSTNLTFTYERISLADFIGQQIRLRFRLDATNNVAVGDGWYIDDIALREADFQVFTLPFIDDVEGTAQCPADGSCWIAGGSWAISSEQVHRGNAAWSDSPGANYQHGTNSSLMLNGEVDLSGTIRPEMRFWNRWHLRPYDHAYVEIATESNNWTVVLDHYNNANLAWTRESIDLTPYIGERIRLRFRLDATNNSSTGDGWWIDDIEITEAATPVITLPWSDDMEAGNAWWVPEGTWALSGEQTHSGGAAWSDSPGGDYVHGTNSSLILDAIVSLEGTAHPELVFWDRYNLRAYDRAYVDISLDDGASWNPIPTWNHYYETNLSWTRQVVDLSPYAGLNVRLRFRMDARSHTQVGDGWWIDDVELREHVETIITLPWCDDFETGTTPQCNDARDFSAFWTPGGQWALTSVGPAQAGGDCRSGNACWTDSPGANYEHLSNATLELDALIDLSGTTNPMLYFWHAYNLRAYDTGWVEVSNNNGISWTRADAAHGTDRVYYSTNMIWTRQQISLLAWRDQQIMIRFRLDARDNTQTGDGWWIDDISVVDYTPRVYTLPFLDEAEPGFLPNWVVEGTWAMGNYGVGGGGGACNNPLCQPSEWTYDDSPMANYAHPTASSMTLDGVVDLSGTTHPVLTVWAIYNLGSGDHVRIQVSVDGGYVWLDPPTPPGSLSLHMYGGADTTWRQHAGDLTNYVSFGQVGLRLHLDARTDWQTGLGVNLDRIEIAD
ncbi:MAG: immune inhibitor A [Anaerolineae bacterium]|nr:immune inhibitor A [Anaerolineae bacterium]